MDLVCRQSPLRGIVEIPGGVQTDFISKMGEKTKGAAETKIIK